MKRFFAKTFSGALIALCSIFLFLVAAGRVASAAPLQQARVSQVIQDVRLLEPHATPRPAIVNDKVTFGRAVRTGVESRAELTFTDLTITRLGANTIFSLTAGARQIDLTNGTILVQVPAKAAAVKINTASVTVGITGGTALLSTGPPLKFMVLEGVGTIYPKGHPEKAATVHGGEMVLMTADGRFTLPQQFDVSLVLATSHLIIDFPPLTNLPLILQVMNQQLAEQQLAGTTTQSLAKNLIDVIDVTDQSATANPIVLAARTATLSSPPPPTPTPPPPTPTPPPPTPTPPPPTPTPPPPTPTPPPPTPTPPPPTPTPTPSKFGPPSVIASPVPYLITSGTAITTDPSITTNGVTDFGKDYRGPTDDGAFSLWAFGSTSLFDTALKIDTDFFANPNNLPIAVFKFQSLSLIGNPTIDLTNGGLTKLGLIAVDGITSGPPGGTLTFTGLDTLVLATVNGSITLTSDISFDPLSLLAMYARGAGSNLTIDSPISNIGDLELAAEGSIQLTNPGTMSVGSFGATAGDDLTLQIGGSLMLNGKVRLETLVLPGTTIASGANLTLNITGDYTNSSTTDFSRLRVINEGHIGTGGNVSVNVTGNLTVTGPGSTTQSPEPGDFLAIVENTNAQIDNGGNLTLTVNGNVNVNGLDAELENYDETANPAGHIGTGGNIDIEIHGDLTTNHYLEVFLNNRGGGTIDSGGNLTLNVTGALTVGAEGAQIDVENRYDDIGGNTSPSMIGSDVSLFVHAASVDIAGALFGSGISNRGGSVINGNATVTWDVPGDVNIQGTVNGASWFVLNDIPPDFTVTPPGGGTIHGSATLTLNIGGDLTIAGDASIFINNLREGAFPGLNGGTIDSNATVDITAANLSVGGELDVFIANQKNGGGGGTAPIIGGKAAITVNVPGTLAATGTDTTSTGIPGDANFQILNESAVVGSPGGSIGGDASININAGSISTAGNFDAEIDNGGGTIGGRATVALDVTGNVSASGANGITLQILNAGGSIAGGMAGDGVSYTVGGTTSTPSLILGVDDTNGGVIHTGGNLTLNTTGPVMLNGPEVMEVDNFNGGSITNGANVTAHFVGDVTDTQGSGHSLNFYVLNGAGFFNPSVTGGTITTGGNINVTFDGNAETTPTSTTGSVASEIENRGGVIGTGGNITFTVGGNVAAGGDGFVADIDNQGGHITSGGNVTVNVAGDVNSIGANVNDGFGVNVDILNQGGQITSGASVTVNVGNDFTSPNGAFFGILNSGGFIGSNASVTFSAAFVPSTAGLFQAVINNSNGTIDGSATVQIGTDGNLTADSLLSRINNIGGSITGNDTINMNVGDTGVVTNDATVQILGNDPTGDGSTAAINFNGGVYQVGGTFLTSIDGDGTITFTNTVVHANVVKAGVFGPNGSLIIGGSGIGNLPISANTLLQLYAPGSNGLLKFIANVTLSSGTAMDLAANTITINNGVIVTIAGAGGAANIFATNANYTGSGGNGSTTGTFAGAGANSPLALSSAPPFDPPATPTTTSSTTTTSVKSPTLATISGTTSTKIASTTLSSSKTTSTKTAGSAINVTNTDQLLSLLDEASVGPDGKATISGSKSTSNLKNLSGTNISGLSRAEHRMLIQQMHDRDTTRLGGKRLL